MKLAKIQELMGQFKNWLKEQEDYSEVYKYENLYMFRAHWDIDAMDFAQMFNESFKSQISNSLGEAVSILPNRSC